jgi:hypothetical protein
MNIRAPWSKLTLFQKITSAILFFAVIVLVFVGAIGDRLFYKIVISIVIPIILIFGIYWWKYIRINAVDKIPPFRFYFRLLLYLAFGGGSIWFLWNNVSSYSIDEIKTLDNVEDVKVAIDRCLVGLDDNSKDLCNEYDNLKKVKLADGADGVTFMFNQIYTQISLISDNCHNNKRLSAQEQIEVQEYFKLQLNKYPNLNLVSKNMLPCW